MRAGTGESGIQYSLNDLELGDRGVDLVAELEKSGAESFVSNGYPSEHESRVLSESGSSSIHD